MTCSKRADRLACRSCQLIGGFLLFSSNKIYVSLLLALIFVISTSAAALADPPIAPPTDPSVIPAISPAKPVLQAPVVAPHQALRALRQGAFRGVNKKIRLYRKAVWHWQSKMGIARTRSSYAPGRVKSVAYANWVLKTWEHRARHLHNKARRWMARRTAYFRETVRHWALVMGKNPVEQLDLPRRTLAGLGNIEAQYDQWRRIEQAVLAEVLSPPYSAEFDCIHHYEGAWTANTGNGYYGGLQMDLAFQRTYGGYLLITKGTADKWTPAEQKLVAVRAHDSGRGFGPWPNTAHACGLI
jgi:hypothetical protein